MILTRAEAKDYSNEPRADLNFVEDGIYPATFVKCSEEQGQFGSQIKWLFTLDEANGIKIFVSIFTSMAWAPGNKLDSLLVVLGIDTTNNFDLSAFNTDTIQKGTKALLMVSKKMSKKGNVYLKVDKWLPYSQNARGAEPLVFPQEHLIMPTVQQQPMNNQQVTVQYNKPINNQAPNIGQQFQQQQYNIPRMTPGQSVNRITTPGGAQNFGNGAPVKKVDFGNNNL